MLDFALLPPEINSGRMYSGPGVGPMLAAAASWDSLAADLYSAATSYRWVISDLASRWLGPSSISFVAAAAPYVAWLVASAAQAEETAAQAKAAVAAYETAFAMTVPPPVIAANRAQLMALVATNLLGQNTAAIAATEAHYGQMWAQDAAAMYGYASSAMTATQLTPFTAPPQTTNSAGPAGQTAAAARVVSGSAGTGTQTALAQLITAMPGALQGLASPAQATSPLQALFLVTLGLSVASLSTSSSAAVYSSMNSRVLVDNSQAILNNSDILLNSQDQLSRTGQQILERIQKLRPTGTPSAIAGGSGVGRAPVLVSASMGQAASAGRLSVPVSWAAAAPEIRAAAYGLPATSVDAAPAASARAAGTAFSEMAFAGMGGSALAGTVSRGRQEYIEATAGDHVKSPQRALESPVTKMAAGIRELGELRDSGLLTDKEFNEQKQRLLCRPPQNFTVARVNS